MEFNAEKSDFQTLSLTLILKDSGEFTNFSPVEKVEKKLRNLYLDTVMFETSSFLWPCQSGNQFH